MPRNNQRSRSLISRLYAKHYFHAYLFIAPVILLFVLFRVLPSVETLLFSLYKVELLRGRFTWLGWENFAGLLQDEIFLQATLNTLVHTVAIVPTSAGLALILAVLFNARLRGQALFRAVYFAPMVRSTVAAAMVLFLVIMGITALQYVYGKRYEVTF